MIDLEASLAAAYRQNAEGCVKIAEDLARYRRILADTRPELIVETGTFSGRSAVWFAQEARCVVVTVDTDQQHLTNATRADGAGSVVWLAGSSVDPDTIDVVRRLALQPQRVMVVLDSWHGTEHVAAELEAYAPLVTPGCYLVVEDTLARHMPDQLAPLGPYEGSPWEAVDAFLATHPGWANDEAVEGMSAVSQHPGGWLRRQ